MNQTPSLPDQVVQLNTLEQRISKEISPLILDYVSLLAPETKKSLRLSYLLSENQKNLLESYNQIGINLLKEYNLDLDSETKNVELFEKFLEISRSIYLARFVEARELFAEYSIYRVPSKSELELANILGETLRNTATVEIKIPGAFILTARGLVDLKATEEQEKTSYLIRSTLSSFSNFMDLADSMLYHIINITLRAFSITMNQRQLTELFRYILQILILEIDKEVYYYLEKGYQPKDARANVQSFLAKMTPDSGTDLPPIFKRFQTDLEEIIAESLEELKFSAQMIAETKKDIFELLLMYCRQGDLVSTNYYKLAFRPYTELRDYEQDYHNLIDVYLFDDFGMTLPSPNECYDIDFSTGFKRELFNLVTNRVVNPTLTLTDYLESD